MEKTQGEGEREREREREREADRRTSGTEQEQEQEQELRVRHTAAKPLAPCGLDYRDRWTTGTAGLQGPLDYRDRWSAGTAGLQGLVQAASLRETHRLQCTEPVSERVTM